MMPLVRIGILGKVDESFAKKRREFLQAGRRRPEAGRQLDSRPAPG
jgi:hypothetical protein